MKAFDYEAVVFDGAIYCIDCVPDGVDMEDTSPIFADDEVTDWPTCEACGTEHDYMTKLDNEETTDDSH